LAHLAVWLPCFGGYQHGIEAFWLDAAVRRRELPVQTHFAAVALFFPCSHFLFQQLPVLDPTSQALTGQRRQLTLGDVQPARMLRRVVDLESWIQTPSVYN
jgi:hypothetical protein